MSKKLKDYIPVPYVPTTTKAMTYEGELIDLPRVRTRFNTNFDALSFTSGLVSDEVTRTQQQFREESDINEIVRRFNLTGQMPDNIRMPQYGDYEGVFDFQTSMNAVRQAAESFMELPAEIRAEFENDPQKLLEFVSNDKNRERAEELGLVPKAKVAPGAGQATPDPAEPA